MQLLATKLIGNMADRVNLMHLSQVYTHLNNQQQTEEEKLN